MGGQLELSSEEKHMRFWLLSTQLWEHRPLPVSLEALAAGDDPQALSAFIFQQSPREAELGVWDSDSLEGRQLSFCGLPFPLGRRL